MVASKKASAALSSSKKKKKAGDAGQSTLITSFFGPGLKVDKSEKSAKKPPPAPVSVGSTESERDEAIESRPGVERAAGAVQRDSEVGLSEAPVTPPASQERVSETPEPVWERQSNDVEGKGKAVVRAVVKVGDFEEPGAYAVIDELVREQESEDSDVEPEQPAPRKSRKKVKVEKDAGHEVWEFEASAEEKPRKPTLLDSFLEHKSKETTAMETQQLELEQDESEMEIADPIEERESSQEREREREPQTETILASSSPSQREPSPNHDSIIDVDSMEEAISESPIPESPNPNDGHSSDDDLQIVSVSTPPRNRPLPTIGPISPPSTPRTTSWTNSISSKRKKEAKLAPLFGPQFVPKSNRPVFRMLHERRRDHAAQLPANQAEIDPRDQTLHKVRSYDKAIAALSVLEDEGIILRDSRHVKELKKKGKLSGWGDSLQGHLDELRRGEKEIWEREGTMDEGAADDAVVSGALFAAELEERVEQELAPQPVPQPTPVQPVMNHTGPTDANATQLTTRISGLAPSIARDLVTLGYNSVSLLREGVILAPKNTDGSVALHTHPLLPPKRGVSEVTLDPVVVDRIKYLPELEKARSVEVLRDVATVVAEEVAKVLGKRVKLDMGGVGDERQSTEGGAVDGEMRMAIVGGLRNGERESRELVLVFEVEGDAGDTMGTILDTLEDERVLLSVFGTKDRMAEAIVAVGEIEADPEIGEDGVKPMLLAPSACKLRLFVVDSALAYVHSSLYHSIPSATKMHFNTRLQMRKYAFDEKQGVFRKRAEKDGPLGDAMDAKSEAEVFRLLELKRGDILKAAGVSAV